MSYSEVVLQVYEVLDRRIVILNIISIELVHVQVVLVPYGTVVVVTRRNSLSSR